MDPKASTLHALFIQGQGTSYAVGQEGELLLSTDGGENWSSRRIATDLNFLGISAAPNGNVVITGMRVMYRSQDAGKTWQPVLEGDTTTDWYQTVRTEAKTGKMYAVGHSGRIIRIGS